MTNSSPGFFLLLCTALAAGCGGDDTATTPGDGGIAGEGGAGRDGSATTDTGTDTDSGSDASADSDAAILDSGSRDTGTGSSGAVNLGKAGTFVILAKSGISTVPTSAVTGDLGISPAPATYITGFSLTADATNVFATSPQVTGKVYASKYADPTPMNLTAAVGDMETAFTDAAGRAPGVTELGAGNIGGKTLTAGVYKWGTGLLIPSDVTLNGKATDVWIMQIAQNLTLSSATKVLLTGGALPKNVFWQVAGAVDVGTTAHLEGVILCKTAVTLRTGASIKGRLLAQTAVSIDKSTVDAPAP